MTEQERAIFYGGLVQQSFVFHVPAGEPRNPEEPTLRAHVAMIVETRDGDRYPMTFQLKWNKADDAWHLVQASRQVSPRMATTPHLVY